LLISAQRAGKDADMVIGDPELFAREILHSFARPSSYAVLSFLMVLPGSSHLLLV
jgi:hypothetical protein